MAGENEGSPGAEVQRTPEFRRHEAGKAVRQVVASEVAKRGSELDTPQTSVDGTLRVFRNLASGNPERGREWNFGGSTKLVIPALSERAEDGSVKKITNEPVVVTKVIGAREGRLICLFSDQDGNPITDESTGKLLDMDVSRETLLDGLMLADRDTFKGFFSGDSETLFTSFVGSLPQNEKPAALESNSDHLIESVAQSANILKRSDIETLVAMLPEAVKNSQELNDRLKNLDGRIIISADDLTALFQGQDTGVLMIQMTDPLEAKVTELSKIPDGEDDAAQSARKAELGEIKKKLAVMGRVSETFAEAEKQRILEEQLDSLENSRDEVADIMEAQFDRLEEEKDDLEQQAKEQAGKDQTPEDVTQSDAYKKKLALQARLTAGIEAKGPLGAITRKGVLEELSRNSDVDQIAVRRLLKPDSAFSQEVSTSEQKLEEFFQEKNIKPEDRLRYREALQDPAKFCELILDTKDGQFAQISEELTDGIFGNLTEQHLTDLFQNLLNAQYDFDPETRRNIGRLLADNKGKIGILALILAAIAAAPFAAAVVAGPTFLGVISKQAQ